MSSLCIKHQTVAETCIECKNDEIVELKEKLLKANKDTKLLNKLDKVLNIGSLYIVKESEKEKPYLIQSSGIKDYGIGITFRETIKNVEERK